TLVGAGRLLPDGSLVTAKKNPGDIDAVVLLPADFEQRAESGDEVALELAEMLLTRQPQELFAAEDEADWQGGWTFSRARTNSTEGIKGRGDPAMIASADEYQKTPAEPQHLEDWLRRLQREHPIPAKGLTKAGVRKMIARQHEELTVYEGSREVAEPETAPS